MYIYREEEKDEAMEEKEKEDLADVRQGAKETRKEDEIT